MLRHLFLLFVMLGLALQPVVASAADKKPVKRVTTKHKVSSKKIISTIEEDSKYQLQNAN